MFSRDPSPSGRGCREAAGEGFGRPENPSSGPSGHLLPGGEGPTAARWLLVVMLSLLFPLSSFAEYRTYDVESLHLTIDTDWTPQGAAGYFPIRLDITNLAEAREIEIYALSNRWLDPYRRGVRPRSVFGGLETGRTDVRQRVRLKRGDRAKLTLPLPVFADSERVQIQIRENGKTLNTSNYFSFQSGRPLTESGAIVVSNRHSVPVGLPPGSRPPNKYTPPFAPPAAITPARAAGSGIPSASE